MYGTTRLSLIKALLLIFLAVCFVTIVYSVYDTENTDDITINVSSKSMEDVLNKTEIATTTEAQKSLKNHELHHVNSSKTKHLARNILEAWSYNQTRNVTAYISWKEESVIHLPTRFCDTEIFLLVIIYSAPENFNTRKTIRETWASQNEVLNQIVDFNFLLGRTDDLAVQGRIEDEFIEYDDVIQDDFYESYYNLSLKSLFMLKNVQNHCLKATKFLLKIDDDIYLNIQNLVKTLTESDTKNLMFGYLYKHVQPIRSTSSKWYAPNYLYEDEYYPPFLSGTAYVMSIDTVPKLSEASLDVPLYHLEDVYLTGFLAKAINVTRRHNEFFSQHKIAFAPCAFMNLITSHGYTDEQLLRLYKRVNEVNLRELCGRRPALRFF